MFLTARLGQFHVTLDRLDHPKHLGIEVDNTDHRGSMILEIHQAVGEKIYAGLVG